MTKKIIGRIRVDKDKELSCEHLLALCRAGASKEMIDAAIKNISAKIRNKDDED